MTATGSSTAAGPSLEGDSAPIRYDIRDGVAVVTLNRPSSRNALSSEMLTGLSAAADRAVSDQARALVLRAADDTFCAGGDLSVVSETFDDNSGALETLVDELHGMISQFRALPIPSVAAVRGAAVGAGMALALATDVRVAGESATFMTGYLAVGSSPDGGASFHLSRALGTTQAVAAFVLNRRFTASELREAGLVDEVVSDADVDDRALALASTLSVISSDALVATRELVYSAPTHGLNEHLDAEKVHFLRVAAGQGFREGVTRFVRRRSADA